jgi:hypothetical protein
VSARVSFKEVILPSHLALNADHRAIGGPHVSFSIQRYSDEKCSRLLTSNNLNAGDGLTTGPMSDGRKALFPESPAVQADFIESNHAAGPLRARVVSKNACTGREEARKWLYARVRVGI